MLTTQLPLAALAGALYCAGFGGFDLWPCAFLAPWPLFWLLRDDPLPARRAVGLGFVFGAVAVAGGYHFLAPVMARFFGFGGVVAGLLFALFCAFHAGQFAMLTWLLNGARAGGGSVTWLAIPLWVLLEWVYPTIFPAYLGVSLHDLPLALQAADIGGPLLLTALVVLGSAGSYELATMALVGRRGRLRLPLVAAGAWAAALLYGHHRVGEVEARMASAERLDVAAVQHALPAELRARRETEGRRRLRALTRALEHTLPAPDLVVWPEAAAGDVGDGSRVYAPDAVPLLYGAVVPSQDPAGGAFYNSALLQDGSGELVARYDKVERLPFSEYLPLPALRSLAPQAGDFAAGSHPGGMRLGAARLGILICYEDVLPGFVRRLVSITRPHVLINLTNDGWFGDTSAPWSHLAMAKLRAVEHHVSLVRATTTGVTAWIDPVGRVARRAPTFEAAVMRAEVPLLTPGSVYGALGDWPGWVALLAFFLGGGRGRRRSFLLQKKKGPAP